MRPPSQFKGTCLANYYYGHCVCNRSELQPFLTVTMFQKCFLWRNLLWRFLQTTVVWRYTHCKSCL